MRATSHCLAWRSSWQWCWSAMLRTLSSPKVLVRVPPLRHRGLGSAWSHHLMVRSANWLQILVVLLLQLVKGMLILLEGLRARDLWHLLAHRRLVVRARKQQLALILSLSDHLRMVVLADVETVGRGERWLRVARCMGLLMHQSVRSACRLRCLRPLRIAVELKHAARPLPVRVLLARACRLLSVLGVVAVLQGNRVVNFEVVRSKVLVVCLSWNALQIFILLVRVDVRLVVLLRLDVRDWPLAAYDWLLWSFWVASDLLVQSSFAWIDSLRLLNWLLVLELEALSRALAAIHSSCSSAAGSGLRLRRVVAKRVVR